MACEDKNQWLKADGGNWKLQSGSDWLMALPAQPVPCEDCTGFDSVIDANELQRFRCNALMPGNNPAWWM